jgi:hypothetical protein
VKEERKVSFFEKKKQKTFALALFGPGASLGSLRGAAFFFSKKKEFLP